MTICEPKTLLTAHITRSVVGAAPTFQRAALLVISLLLASPLTACSGNSGIGLGGGTSLTTNETAAPVQLNATGVKLHQSPRTVVMSVDAAAAAKAVQNYRINKGGQPGAYEYRGADLNGDGTPELIVYLTGEGWCVKTGCTLAILREDNHGYQEISTILRVKRPIRVAGAGQNGWRTLLVNTGGAGMPLQTVALKFSGSGYPANATVLAPVPIGQDAGSEPLFVATTSPPSSISSAFQ